MTGTNVDVRWAAQRSERNDARQNSGGPPNEEPVRSVQMRVVRDERVTAVEPSELLVREMHAEAARCR